MRVGVRVERAVCVVAVAATASVVAFATPARAAVFAPQADAYVSNTARGANHGTSRHLLIGARPLARGFLRFDVRGLQGRVASARLRVRALRGSADGFRVRTIRAGVLSERHTTLRNAPHLSLQAIAASGPFAAGRWVTVDVTAAVRGNGLVTLALTTTSAHQIVLASREAGPRSAPQLEVTTVAPGAVAPIVAPVGPVGPVGPPAVQQAPTITGYAWATRTLTASSGAWTGAVPIDYSYQWQRCAKTGDSCRDIAGATASTYAVVAADLASRLRVVVRASNADGTATATSDATDPVIVAPKSPALRSKPSISGMPRETHDLAVSNGKWNGATPLTFTYQWQRCDASGAACVDIPDATLNNYTADAPDVGATLRVAVTASNIADAVTAYSSPTSVVVAEGAPFAGAVWHMDERSGTTMIDSMGTATGHLKGVKVGAPGWLGTGYSFSGSGTISVSSKSLNPGSLPFSVTVHINTTKKPSAAVGDYDLIRKGLSATSGGDYKMEILQGGNAFCYFRGNSGSASVSGGGNLADGSWHTITCAKSDSRVTLTVDGRTWSSGGKVGAISNSASLLIGSQGGGIDVYSGLMDEVDVTVG
jgi:hypothetical protein